VLGGVRDLQRVPDVVFLIDIKVEHIAVSEAARLGITSIAVVDSNCDPDDIDLVIPGNDDAIRSVHLMANLIADAAIAGNEMRGAKSKDADPVPAVGEDAE
jgi:small subunit ribosomal protein S2